MSNKSRHKHGPRAPDILGKSQNWVQKVSSLRVSNIRVGQHLTSLLGEKERLSGIVNDSAFLCSFVKLSRFRCETFIIAGGISGLRLFKSYFSSSTVDFTTELIFEFLDMKCLDGCFFGRSDAAAGLLMKSFDDNDPHYFIRTVDINNPSHFNERKFSGQAQSLSSSNAYLFVGLAQGLLRVFDPVGLEPVAEIPSVPYASVIYATSPRWIAVESKYTSGDLLVLPVHLVLLDNATICSALHATCVCYLDCNCLPVCLSLSPCLEHSRLKHSQRGSPIHTIARQPRRPCSGRCCPARRHKRVLLGPSQLGGRESSYSTSVPCLSGGRGRARGFLCAR